MEKLATHHHNHKEDTPLTDLKKRNPKSVPAKEKGFSVLMSVYHKERAPYFRVSLESIFHQTLMPPEVILVCDGMLTPQLDAVIDEFYQRYPNSLNVIRLPLNQGLGNALNYGMDFCSYEIIARMDSDDYALSTRFEKQISYMYEHPEVDLLNCAINEFGEDHNKIDCRRMLPSEHEEIYDYAKLRCPVNHPSVVFRKKAVVAAGGYQDFYLFEDYYLWVRMLMNGAVFHSLNEALLNFRMSPDTYARRKGRTYNKSELKLQREFLRIGFINRFEYVRNLLLRLPPRYFPKKLLRRFYMQFLRHKPNEAV